MIGGRDMSNPAEGYESFMVPALFRPWAENLIEAAAPARGERVLDVGCGTGIVARLVAARSMQPGAVVALDLSAHMLEVARAVSARDGLPIQWLEGSAGQLPFPERSFDVVLCQFALMFFADQAAALKEMRRVVTRDGRIVLSVWQGLDRHPFYQVLHEVIQRRIGVSALEDIFSLGNAEMLHDMATGVGFRQVSIEPVSMTARFPNPEAFLAGEIDVDTAAIPSMQHLDAVERGKIVAAITSDMRAALSGITRDDRVLIPFHAFRMTLHP
jgi:ubiquinone/menaquinone biosynthesis C-methylase UbiE